MTDSSREPPGLPARRAALRLLDAVLRRGLPLETALDGATRELDRADDRGLAHAIAAETLRRLPDLDAIIDSATRQKLPADAKARFALRVALVQALALKTPHHAAIATVLPLVDGGPRRLVHGVFGALMRRKVGLPALPSLPAAVARRWGDAWGRDMVEAARHAIAAPPPLDLTGPGPLPDGVSLAPGHVRLPAGADVAGLAGYAEGHWWVQDLAASLPARLLGSGDGRAALDLCAAPGGKAMQLAAAGWRVTAVEANESRLARLRENLGRTCLRAELVHADVMTWRPAAPCPAILLDAPCTATGVFRRHPEVLHRVRDKDIAAMAELQAAMLARAADWLEPEGRLVYAVCSLEPEEGEARIEGLLAARDDLALDPVGADELPAGLAPHPRGWVRTLPTDFPDSGRIDGFFVARLKRLGDKCPARLAGPESGG